MSDEIKLPEPAFRLRWDSETATYKVSKPNIGDTDVYTAEQVRALLADSKAGGEPLLVRDLAAIIGRNVPEVSAAITDLGLGNRSTNMALHPDEAVAVAKHFAGNAGGESVAMLFEVALSELIDKICPGLDSGNLLDDAKQASAALSKTERAVPEDTVSNRHMIAENPGSAIAIMQDQQRQIHTLKSALLAADSKAGGEVAYMREGWDFDCGTYVEFYRADEMGWRDKEGWTPLYARPQQQAKPLTDDVAVEIVQSAMNEEAEKAKDGTWREFQVNIVRKVERALGIGDQA